MINDWKKRFWQDFELITQEQDPSVNFVNPSDVSRSLIKARNWSSTLVQELAITNRVKNDITLQIRKKEKELGGIEKMIFALTERIPSFAVKSRDIQKTFIFSIASELDRTAIITLENEINDLNNKLSDIQQDIDELELMRKALEKTTDWLIQYLNWYKYEMRILNE